MSIKKFNSLVLTLSLILVLIISPLHAAAENQPLDDEEILNIENLYKNTAPPAPTEESSQAPPPETPLNAPENTNVESASENEPVKKIENLTDLNKLSAFREISVIQKKYLPKTERFQLFAGAGTTTNSPWFLNLGVKVNIGYYFTESLGIELSGIFLTNSEREVAKEIRTNNQLQPEKFINTKNYAGLDLVWAPIYGKLTMLNNRIIPFDMYFSLGGGTSSTNSQEGSVPTFHIGAGQIFAVSKSMAIRWDYSWTMFQATPIPDNILSAGGAQKNTYNDLILTAGLSFFFPEAKYR